MTRKFFQAVLISLALLFFLRAVQPKYRSATVELEGLPVTLFSRDTADVFVAGITDYDASTGNNVLTMIEGRRERPFEVHQYMSEKDIATDITVKPTELEGVYIISWKTSTWSTRDSLDWPSATVSTGEKITLQRTAGSGMFKELSIHIANEPLNSSENSGVLNLKLSAIDAATDTVLFFEKESHVYWGRYAIAEDIYVMTTYHRGVYVLKVFWNPDNWEKK